MNILHLLSFPGKAVKLPVKFLFGTLLAICWNIFLRKVAGVVFFTPSCSWNIRIVSLPFYNHFFSIDEFFFFIDTLVRARLIILHVAGCKDSFSLLLSSLV